MLAVQGYGAGELGGILSSAHCLRNDECTNFAHISFGNIVKYCEVLTMCQTLTNIFSIFTMKTL